MIHIRYAFIELFVNILCNFEDFIILKNERSISNPILNSKSVPTTKPMPYDKESFISTKDIKEREFIRAFMETNLVTSWIFNYSRFVFEKPVPIYFRQTAHLFIEIQKQIKNTPLTSPIDYSILDVNVPLYIYIYIRSRAQSLGQMQTSVILKGGFSSMYYIKENPSPRI